MSNEFKLIDVNAAQDKLALYIERTKRQLAAVKLVIESLRGLEGQKLNKHLTNKLTKLHPELKFSIGATYSWYTLSVDGEGFDSISLNVGYTSQTDSVEIPKIVEHNQRYLLDEVRIPKYEAELATVKERATRYNEALFAFRAAHEALGEGSFAFSDNSTPRIKNAQGNYL